ncbi:MAG: glycoside hydrolase family 44 protein [Fimbriimonadales bacterium]|nr:glycoside hydrolase family 44 protein [Fimbriimonadales bacterium]
MHTLLAALALAQTPTQAYTVDPAVGQPISPYIYGANFPDWRRLGPLFPLARQGGNRMSAYNWETNASNAGSDWHHQNDGYMGQTDEPGWTVRTFVEDAVRHGAAALVTVPCTGYVAADKKADGDVAQTPNHLETRFHRSYPRKNGPLAYPPDTTDRAVYQDEFAAWISKFARPNAPVWFSLDNEVDLWGFTHQRIWPRNPTYAQILQIGIEYAQAIKAVAPRSLVFGPVSYGWQGFRTFQDAPDANGRDFLDFYLAGMRAAGQRAGRRLLDVLDIHWYPEARGGGVRVTSPEATPALVAARVQAPRSLWDPTYVEDSWIAENLGRKPIALLPGLLEQIRRQYPGTRLAITEYDYGGGRDASGLVAQADVLGIFGRHGVFAAAHWGISPDRPATVAAFRAFRDYDGRGGKFGSRSLRVQGGDPAVSSLYASSSPDRPGRLVLVAVNKSSSPTSFEVSLRGFSIRSAAGYRLDGANLRSAVRFQPQVGRGALRFQAPALSVSTVEVVGAR